MSKTIFRILFIVFLALVMIFLAFSGFLGWQVVQGSTQLFSNEETRDVSETFLHQHGIDAEVFQQAHALEILAIDSTLGDHVVPADYLYADASMGSKDHPTVVLVHGLGGNRYTNYPLAEYFLDLGYNVLSYDQRSSNENTAPYNTFGYLEKYDLIDAVNWVHAQAPSQQIGIWGTSFGGATAGLGMATDDMDEKIDFLILDCPVSSMGWMVETFMSQMDVDIPLGYLMWCGDIVNRLKLGFGYDDVEVPTAMTRVETPVLVINSKLDEVTPFFMGQDIYDAISHERKQIWTVEDSAHTAMWLDHNAQYRETVRHFLETMAENPPQGHRPMV